MLGFEGGKFSLVLYLVIVVESFKVVDTVSERRVFLLQNGDLSFLAV